MINCLQTLILKHTVNTIIQKRRKLYYPPRPTLGKGFDDFLWSKGPYHGQEHVTSIHLLRTSTASYTFSEGFLGSPHQILTNVPLIHLKQKVLRQTGHSCGKEGNWVCIFYTKTPQIDSQLSKYLNARADTWIFKIKIYKLTLTLICKHDLDIISKD